MLGFATATFAETAAERRAVINKRSQEALAKLYQVHPAAKAKIASAYGYAVFTNLGVKDFRGIFVFRTQKAFHDFVEDGWEAGGHADAVAKAGKDGGALEGAISVAPGTELYQLTENGLSLEATIQGTKYFKDGDLNAK